MVRAHVGQAAQPDAPAARGLATAAIRIAIAAGRSEHAQGAAGEAVSGQDRRRHVADAVEVLLDLIVGAGLWWGTMHTGPPRDSGRTTHLSRPEARHSPDLPPSARRSAAPDRSPAPSP